MEGQLLVVAVIVAGAAWYLGRATWRSWRMSKSGCGGGCGCATKSPPSTQSTDQVKLISTDELTFRLRDKDRA